VSESRWGIQIDKEKKPSLEQPVMFLYSIRLNYRPSSIRVIIIQEIPSSRILADCVKWNTRQGEKSRTAATTTFWSFDSCGSQVTM
jgi:hypothetical protein